MSSNKTRPFGLHDLMWRFVLPPVLAVSGIWLVMSLATTIYVYWMETSQKRILDENLGTIHAAVALQESAHRIGFALLLDRQSQLDFARLWPARLADLSNRQRTLQATIHTDEEQERVRSLESYLTQVRELGSDASASIDHDGTDESVGTKWASRVASMRELIGQIDLVVWDLVAINQRLVNEASQWRTRVGYGVLLVRLTMLVSGPALGVWLGWRLSRRLHRSVARIAVTLRQSEQGEVPLGTLTVDTSGSLQSVQEEAEQIVGRLREAHRELEQANREVERSERLAAVGQLAAGVAHELRNPLTSIKLLLQHASQSPEGALVGGSKLQLILEEIGRMEATIQGLLDFSRQQPLRRSSHDVKEPLQRALNLLDGRARQARVHMHCDLPTETIKVDGDPDLLHQVFVNLGLNAIEAMPHGGSLTVVVRAGAADGRIYVEFQDEGAGITDEAISHIFEPFWTTKERGTGLGLAISRRIVDQHGGLLMVANRELRGAVMTVELPVAAAP